MKKIIYTLFLVFSLNYAVFAIQAETSRDYENFKKSLRLNLWQSYKINKIEEKSNAELEEIYKKIRNYESGALLLKMEAARLNRNYYLEIQNFESSSHSLQKRANEIVSKKEGQILAVLSKSQKEKYLEYKSRVY